jgi:crotonobetainyl-CoA:carnitine CoA-transferase CaiB-like acyl-CoA transferase
MAQSESDLPLAGVRVIERSRGPAAAYAGRLLAALGATTIMLEDEGGTPLRREPPLLKAAQGASATFAYLCAGKHSLVCNPRHEAGRRMLHAQLACAEILLDDTPLEERAEQELDSATLAKRHPHLVHVSLLPFGAHGEKAGWSGSEVNLIHAGGEGFLLPNGLSQSLFPARAPLKIYGHFAAYQGGASAAMAALAALWQVPSGAGQYVDSSVQDATVAVGAFALQRLGDGSLEHRATRSFRYGGVFETSDGFVELLMLEDRQWRAFVELMGNPGWAMDEALNDPLERSRRGTELNKKIQAWIRERSSAEIVDGAQVLGVPAAQYRTPEQVLQGEHERARGLFEPVALSEGTLAQMLVAPFHFVRTPLHAGAVPDLGDFDPERDPGATPSDMTCRPEAAR